MLVEASAVPAFRQKELQPYAESQLRNFISIIS